MMESKDFSDLAPGDVFIAEKRARAQTPTGIDIICAGGLFMKIPSWETAIACGNAIELILEPGMRADKVAKEMRRDDLYEIEMGNHVWFEADKKCPVAHLGDLIFSSNKCEEE